MTNELKNLMTEAADNQGRYAPDVEALVRSGRRQVRRRRIVASVATVAAIGIVVGATTIAVNSVNRSSEPPVLTPSPSPSLPSVGPGGSTGRCTFADGKGAPSWNWPVVLYVQDTFGMSIVRRSPANPKVTAYCTTEWGDGARLSVVPGGPVRGVVLRKSAAVGRGALPESSVTTVFGVVPHGTPRVTVETKDGYVGVAKVKDGHFAYRRVEHSPWPGPAPRVIVRFKYPGQPEYVAASR